VIQEARAYEAKKLPKSELGVRVLVTRRWLQGISKRDIDVWLPAAGPSVALLKTWREGLASWSEFARSYETEQREQTACAMHWYHQGERLPDESVSVSPLECLRRLEAANGLVTVMCWEDTPCECHRHLLVAMMNEKEEVK